MPPQEQGLSKQVIDALERDPRGEPHPSGPLCAPH